MLGVIMSCIIVCYLYNKTVILERKVDYLKYELIMINKHIYEPSAPILMLDN